MDKKMSVSIQSTMFCLREKKSNRQFSDAQVVEELVKESPLSVTTVWGVYSETHDCRH